MQLIEHLNVKLITGINRACCSKREKFSDNEGRGSEPGRLDEQVWSVVYELH